VLHLRQMQYTKRFLCMGVKYPRWCTQQTQTRNREDNYGDVKIGM
jgi:hypothetical protein